MKIKIERNDQNMKFKNHFTYNNWDFLMVLGVLLPFVIVLYVFLIIKYKAGISYSDLFNFPILISKLTIYDGSILLDTINSCGVFVLFSSLIFTWKQQKKETDDSKRLAYQNIFDKRMEQYVKFKYEFTDNNGSLKGADLYEYLYNLVLVKKRKNVILFDYSARLENSLVFFSLISNDLRSYDFLDSRVYHEQILCYVTSHEIRILIEYLQLKLAKQHKTNTLDQTLDLLNSIKKLQNSVTNHPDEMSSS